MELIERRRNETKDRLDQLRKNLSEAERIAQDKGCVYLTGSFARGEATQHSDLDLFIVGRLEAGKSKTRLLSRLDEICIKADLIESTRKFGIPDFSGDGEYLLHYAVEDLVETLGKPDDDSRNTFTARLLLLLESRPLFGVEVYKEAIKNVVAAYWRDFEDHKNDFMPAFLANDILRLWRTFCVNYEARTRTDPAEKKAKRKLKNYKLKHSRLLTCYSALGFLLAVSLSKQTVTPNDAIEMTVLSPTQRLEWIAKEFSESQQNIKDILIAYESFLSETDAAEEELVKRFLDPDKSRAYFAAANSLGDKMYNLLAQLGNGNRFYRLLLV